MEVDRHVLRDESGTTLAELLVVILLLGIVGAVTTVGIVQGFGAQLTSTKVADTLDGTRLATQRVRDFARGADEVCASSSNTSLVLWTDDDGDGVVVDEELDIFELVTDDGQEVFQRRVPSTTGTDLVQLIRDDIINAALFAYDVAPAAQPADIKCTDGVAPSGGPSRTRTVDVTFQVGNPDPSQPDLTTSTSVQVRNAGLEGVPGVEPFADFTFDCPAGVQECTFDGSLSTDDDGTIAAWQWDFGDGTSAAGDTVTHSYALGDQDYEVTLTVVDNDGLLDTFTTTVRPGIVGSNARPVARFTFSCIGLICDFDASTSTDDSGIASYAWDFGDGTTGSGVAPQHTFGANGDYVVTLTVTDDDPTTPLSHSKVTSVTASTEAMRVESITAVGSAAGGSPSRWTASITVQLSLTTTGDPGNGITISATAESTNSQNVSCSTDVDGRCTIEVAGINANKSLVFTVTQVNDPDGPYTYDADQNLATTVTVNPNTTVTAP